MTVDTGRTIEYRGTHFLTVGKGTLHCQTCLQTTHDQISHATKHAEEAAAGTSLDRSAHGGGGEVDAGFRGALAELADVWSARDGRHWLDEVALAAHPESGTDLSVLTVPSGGVKMLRETLARAQAALARRPMSSSVRADIDRLGALIRQCDVNRPLGPDREHGDRRTATCGCEGGETS
ncbi:hypothetical protein ACFWGN_20810 [Oerskovia sp. NPDC060338]|uniref:hypothetical protein n=1 Tax=Oerskovia sp. NPDC060338 TaxID=3347100 RepID=UPI003659AF2D